MVEGLPGEHELTIGAISRGRVSRRENEVSGELLLMCHDRRPSAFLPYSLTVRCSILWLVALYMCVGPPPPPPSTSRLAAAVGGPPTGPETPGFPLPQLMGLRSVPFTHCIVATGPALCSDRFCALYFKPVDGWRCHGDDSIPPLLIKRRGVRCKTPVSVRVCQFAWL